MGITITNNNDNVNNNNNNNNNTIISNLLYADDIVLLSETEIDLQEMIKTVDIWCKKWRMEINLDKTNILHIRKKSQQRSNFVFKFGQNNVKYCECYKYLGLTINEHLDFKFSTDILAQSGGRAMSSIITKMIKNGGFPLNVYKNLFESCVCTVTDYAGEIWGFKSYESNKQVQLKASRAFLGVPKQTPISGILSELNWPEPRSRTQLQMVRHFHRMNKMDDGRLIKKVFLWDKSLNDSGLVHTWSSEVQDILHRNGLDNIYNMSIFPLKRVITDLKASLLQKDQISWQSHCRTLPKLRTFIQFKNFVLDSPHIFKPLSFMQRKQMSKFRLGILHLRVETGRFLRIPPEDRVCLMCNSGEVEDESHFLLVCSRYEQYRQNLF